MIIIVFQSRLYTFQSICPLVIGWDALFDVGCFVNLVCFHWFSIFKYIYPLSPELREVRNQVFDHHVPQRVPGIHTNSTIVSKQSVVNDGETKVFF